MQSIAIVNYGMGNVHSVQKALEHVAPNDHIFLTDNPQSILNADRLVFPGQGSMGACMQALNQHHLAGVIQSCSLEKPFFGICVGLQLLFDRSEENGGTDGLGIVSGKSIRFTNKHLKVPHMGWNKVKQSIDHPLWHYIDDEAYFYYVHSYYLKTQDERVVAGVSHYGVDFTCAIARENLFAVQFHPEKSQHDGLQLLKNFVHWQV